MRIYLLLNIAFLPSFSLLKNKEMQNRNKTIDADNIDDFNGLLMLYIIGVLLSNDNLGADHACNCCAIIVCSFAVNVLVVILLAI